ncbi:hypothetical protein ES703_40997 [subsurface metagenome]
MIDWRLVGCLVSMLILFVAFRFIDNFLSKRFDYYSVFKLKIF